ncbi:MAG: hypothetical protein LUE98_08425 [Tannerellaceae bacterium]|nr:hypothetical protein [Tannerellaceae bacterium]
MNMKQFSFFRIILLIGLLVWGYMISFPPSKGKEQTESECGLKDTILLVDTSDHVYKMGTSITPREYVDTIITPHAEIKIYHGWNGLTEEWDPYVRYTKSTPDLPDRKKHGDKTCGTQTFLYERYDLTTQTWVGDLKMETETIWAWQDDRYVREQQNTTKSLWSKELQQWIDTFYINTKYCGYWHEAVCNGTMYEIATTSGEKNVIFILSGRPWKSLPNTFLYSMEYTNKYPGIFL